jgi:dTDP-4-dehydrorhamnose reductase
LAKLIENLKNDSLPPAFTDHILTPTFADNVASVFNYCVKNKPTGLYHLTGSSSHSDYDIALMVKDVFELPGQVNPGTLAMYLETVKRPYQKTMRISNQKLKNDFGLTLLRLEEGLEAVRKQSNP